MHFIVSHCVHSINISTYYGLNVMAESSTWLGQISSSKFTLCCLKLLLLTKTCFYSTVKEESSCLPLWSSSLASRWKQTCTATATSSICCVYWPSAAFNSERKRMGCVEVLFSPHSNTITRYPPVSNWRLSALSFPGPRLQVSIWIRRLAGARALGHVDQIDVIVSAHWPLL